MAEKGSHSQGKLNLLKLLQEQESEITRLNGESQKLQRQLEALLISMNTVKGEAVRPIEPAAESALQSERDELFTAEGDISTAAAVVAVEEAVPPVEAAVPVAEETPAATDEEPPAIEEPPIVDEEPPVSEGALPDAKAAQLTDGETQQAAEPLTAEEELSWMEEEPILEEQESEIKRLTEENQKLQRRLTELLSSAEEESIELQGAEEANPSPDMAIEAEAAAPEAAPGLPIKVKLRKLPRY